MRDDFPIDVIQPPGSNGDGRGTHLGVNDDDPLLDTADTHAAISDRPRRPALLSRILLGLGLATSSLSAGSVASIAASPPPEPSGHGLPEPASPEQAAPLSQHEKWQRRFPQPVLVSDLIGRKVLDRDQGTLGRIATLVTTPDGQVMIAFKRTWFFVFDGPTVAVPAEVAALLGPFVMILDLTADEIETLPAFASAGTVEVDRTSRILMALTKH